jgi:hypothetical protein
MLLPARLEGALSDGAGHARDLIELRPEGTLALTGPSSGFLIAECDSWFNYPLSSRSVG